MHINMTAKVLAPSPLPCACANMRRAARSRARDPCVGARTATAQDQAESAGLGGTAGAVGCGGGGSVERLAQKIMTKRYDACSTHRNLRTGGRIKGGTASARSDAMR